MTLRDEPERWPVTASTQVLRTGRVISVRQDTVRPPDHAPPLTRDVVVHPGAVGIVVLDDDERMLVVDQYRHPVGHRLVEPPAGLLDVDGEDYLVAAQRELYEEGHVRAADWRILAEMFTSPGMSNEMVRIYLARGLTHVDEGGRHVGQGEEAHMAVAWAPLGEVVAGILAGDLHNPLLCVGALTAWAARAGDGYDALRDADAPWPAREALPR